MDTFPDSAVSRIMCASILLKEGKAPKADELLTQFAEKHPDCATDAHLVRAQAAAAAGNYLQAAKCLEMVTSLKHKPGVVATVVALKERGGNLKGAESVLDEALEYWDSHMGEDDANSTLECIMQVRFLVYCRFIILQVIFHSGSAPHHSMCIPWWDTSLNCAISLIGHGSDVYLWPFKGPRSPFWRCHTEGINIIC